MNSKIASEYILQSLEKQDSGGYANFTKWDLEDSLNRQATDWFRRQVYGTNQRQEQQEESTMVTDDIQNFLVEKKMSVVNNEFYADSIKIPENYRYYNKLSVYCSSGDCKKILIPSLFIENANTDSYSSDWSLSPSFDFEQCFHVLLNNRFRVFHMGEFKVDYIRLFYFREPKKISMDSSNIETEWEWKEDVAQLIIENSIKQLAGSIEHITANQIADKNQINNN